jgi:hypothetical protein
MLQPSRVCVEGLPETGTCEAMELRG